MATENEGGHVERSEQETSPPPHTNNRDLNDEALPPSGLSLRIAGIGASAGGLEALEQLFRSVPPDTGIAFVIVQHLDPSRRSSMDEILPRFTAMPVQVATDGMEVRPDSIYLIPPNKSMGIQGGVLYLEEPAQPPGVRLPVDFFLTSLAKDEGQDAIAIILSGTGSDGTAGLRAIKAELGTVLVQAPESAAYDGMPRSAIGAGLADFVLTPGEMGEKLVQLVRHPVDDGTGVDVSAEQAGELLMEIFEVLRAKTGHDFSGYKRSTIMRRLQRRMSASRSADLRQYTRLFRESEDEVQALLKDVLISVTGFFRDPAAFDALKDRLKGLLEGREAGSELRAWVAGCATGEEAYSVAMLISECLDELDKRMQVQVFGTDIDGNALRVARAARYPAAIAADVTPERLRRFFTERDDIYQLNKEIRGMVVFAPHNLIKDPPLSRMDLVCCRNLLIYLGSELQGGVLPLLHWALNPGGILFLGPSETAKDAHELFEVLDRSWKIFRRREGAPAAGRLKFPPPFGALSRRADVRPATQANAATIRQLAEKAFLDNYAPAFAVIDEAGRLVYVRGRTGRYLEIASGQPSLSIMELARPGLGIALAPAIQQATSKKEPVSIEGVRVSFNGGFQTIRLIVAPLAEAALPRGTLMVVFQETSVAEEVKTKLPIRGSKRVAELEQEIRLLRSSLQAANEEREMANEELKSTNEELQSNNEELRSTNEEMETSREELQSLNEELSTLNSEVQDKNQLLAELNDDLNNLLDRVSIGIILVDEKLSIRRFTPAMRDVLYLRDIDVGRPLNEISSRLAYDGVMYDAGEVLRTGTPKEAEVQRTDGRWYQMRIFPYLTYRNVVSGLIVMFLDIDQHKRTSEELREARDYLGNLLDRADAPIVVWDSQMKVTRFNSAFEKLTGRSATEVLGRTIDILLPEDKRGEALLQLQRSVDAGQRLVSVEIPVQRIDGSVRTVLWNSATVYSADGKSPLATIAQGQDITEYKRVEQMKDDFIGMVTHEIRTPLTVIIGALDLSLSEGLSPEDRRGVLNDAGASAASLTNIVDNLVELSRHQSGRLMLRRRPVSIEEVIAQTRENLGRLYPARNVMLDVAEGLTTVMADPDRLRLVLRNLLENAFKYSPNGTDVSVLARREDGNLFVSISDHGPGIAAEERQKLFQPFVRLEESGGAAGLGLGLVVCKRLIEAQGGRIWIESKPGHGATFAFTIPIGEGTVVRTALPASGR